MLYGSHMTEAGADRGAFLASQFRAKKSIDRMIADSELPQFRLNKSLGPWSMIAIGVGAIIGEGIYLRASIAAGSTIGRSRSFSLRS